MRKLTKKALFVAGTGVSAYLLYRINFRIKNRNDINTSKTLFGEEKYTFNIETEKNDTSNEDFKDNEITADQSLVNEQNPQKEISSEKINMDKILEESKSLSLSEKIAADDYIILIDVDNFNPQFTKKVEDVLNEMRKRNKKIKIFCVESSDLKNHTELGPLLDLYSFAIFKKSSGFPEVFSPMSFIANKSDLFLYFTPLKQLENLNGLALSKQEFALASCGRNENSIKSLESLRPLIPHSMYFDYENCSTLQGDSNDLFLLKKHSSTHSLDEKNLKELDGHMFDVFKMDNFFIDFSSQKRKEKARVIEEKIAKSVVFNPPGQEELNWSLLLEFDYNTTSRKSKIQMLEALKSFYTVLDNDSRKKLAISYHHEPISQPRLRLANRAKMRVYEMSQMCQDKQMLNEIQSKFPFLMNQENKVWFYKYPHSHFSSEKIKEFYDKGLKGELEDFHQSEEKSFWKVSMKQTFETFGKMAHDGKDHIILLYNNSKESVPVRMIFEKLCMENLKFQTHPDLEFDRINIDKNSLSECSPKILFVKKNIPSVMTMSSTCHSAADIKTFIDILSRVKIENSLMKAFKDKKDVFNLY